jgi:phosphoheptose isomerase
VLDDVIRRGATLWVAGNGGSAAVSNHAACDLTKWTLVEGARPLRCMSLSCNAPMLTALANDLGYDEVFSKQLSYHAKPGDALLAVSSSGNASNLIRACEFANAAGMTTVAFVGFDGGALKKVARHSVWIPVANYGIVEDSHQSLVHVLAQYLRTRAEH